MYVYDDLPSPTVLGVRVHPYHGLNGKIYPNKDTVRALLKERIDKDQAERRAIKDKIIRIREFLLKEGVNLEKQLAAILDPLWEQDRAIWAKHENFKVVPIESNRGQTIEALEGWRLQ